MKTQKVKIIETVRKNDFWYLFVMFIFIFVSAICALVGMIRFVNLFNELWNIYLLALLFIGLIAFIFAIKLAEEEIVEVEKIVEIQGVKE